MKIIESEAEKVFKECAVQIVFDTDLHDIGEITSAENKITEALFTAYRKGCENGRERTAEGIVKQIESLDLTGVNQVISLIYQIDKWMPLKAVREVINETKE